MQSTRKPYINGVLAMYAGVHTGTGEGMYKQACTGVMCASRQPGEMTKQALFGEGIAMGLLNGAARAIKGYRFVEGPSFMSRLWRTIKKSPSNFVRGYAAGNNATQRFVGLHVVRPGLVRTAQLMRSLHIPGHRAVARLARKRNVIANRHERVFGDTTNGALRDVVSDSVPYMDVKNILFSNPHRKGVASIAGPAFYSGTPAGSSFFASNVVRPAARQARGAAPAASGAQAAARPRAVAGTPFNGAAQPRTPQRVVDVPLNRTAPAAAAQPKAPVSVPLNHTARPYTPQRVVDVPLNRTAPAA